MLIINGVLFCFQVTTEPDQVKQRDLWITDFAPMQNIYKLALALTSKEIGKKAQMIKYGYSNLYEQIKKHYLR